MQSDVSHFPVCKLSEIIDGVCSFMANHMLLDVNIFSDGFGCFSCLQWEVFLNLANSLCTTDHHRLSWT